MIILHDDDRDPRDDELFAALRAEYFQPSDSSYWAFLERRIMGRVTAEGAREWWSYFPAWGRAGLAAAALALLVAGITAWQTREAQQEVARDEDHHQRDDAAGRVEQGLELFFLHASRPGDCG